MERARYPLWLLESPIAREESRKHSKVQDSTEPRHSAFGRSNCVVLGCIFVARKMADRSPGSEVFWVSPELLEAKCAIRSSEDINATVAFVCLVTGENQPGFV